MSKIQDKITKMRKAMCESLVEREDEIDLGWTAAIAQQHVLLVGPPGTAKSLVVDSIRKAVKGARSLPLHCCKDTSRGAAFGSIDIPALVKEGKTQRVLTGGAADVHILILEEVFKSSDTVLNMFLLLMNERKYWEGLIRADAPLLFILGVSNEWSPEGCENALSAFFDRFLLRRAVHPIRTQVGFEKLVKLPIKGMKVNRSHEPKFTELLTLEEIKTAHVESEAMEFTPDTAKAFFEIRKELTAKGIMPGDRRWKASVGVAQAYAYLQGAKEVEPEHLEVLKDVLWIDPAEQPAEVAKTIARIANPVGMLVTDLRHKADDVFEKTVDASEAVEALSDILQSLKVIKPDPRRDMAMDYVSDLKNRSLLRSIGVKEKKKELV